jgi:hypothetical protein
MAGRLGVLIYGLVFALAFSIAPSAQEFEKKQDETMRKEAEAFSKLAEDALVARGGPNDFNITWVSEDFLQGPSGKQFVPFTFSVDPTKVNGGTVMVYWRVVPQAAVAAAAAAGRNAKRVEPVWERAGLVSLAGATAPVRLSRSFEAPAGTYDVYVVMKEIPSEKAPRNSPAPKTVVVKETVEVPDFWNNALATSSVVVLDKIEPLPAPLNNAQLMERPYARLGVFELYPSASTKFTKANQLSVFFLIYNPKNEGGKPDLNIEYTFCQIVAGNQPADGEPCKAGEKFYNRTAPQVLNSTTLPAQFDLNAGHMLPSEQAVPLSGFPAGDYRLEIKVTDKLGNATITRDVNFSVS